MMLTTAFDKCEEAKKGFQIGNLTVLSYSNNFTHWHYVTECDTLAKVCEPTYFTNTAGMFSKGDLIVINAQDGNVLKWVVECTYSNYTVIEG